MFLKPVLAIRCPFLGQQHVHHLHGLVSRLHGQLHQTPSIRVNGGLTQLQRVHFTQSLEPLHIHLAPNLLRLDAIQDPLLLRIVQCVEHLLAHVDAVERRHGHEDVPLAHQLGKVAHEERAQQRGDVQPVGIGIGQDADLAEAQLREVVAAGLHADGHRDVVHLLGGEHFRRVHLPGVEDLAAQGHDRLEILVPRLLGRAARGVPLHQEQLGAGHVVGCAVGQFPRQGRSLGHLLAHHLAPGAHAALRGADGQLGDAFTIGGMLVEPEAEGVLHHARDEGGALARGEPLLGLAGELGIRQFHREHVAHPAPDVLGSDLHAARQQVAELAELAYRLGEPRAQAVHVGAPLGGGDQVDVALGDRLAALGQPCHGPVRRLVATGHAAGEGFRRQQLPAAQGIEQVVLEAVLVLPLLGFTAVLVVEHHLQAGAEHGLGAQHMLELAHAELRAVEEAGIGPETDARAGIALAHLAHLFQVGDLLAVGEGDVVLGAIALDPNLQVTRQGIHHRHAHAVEAAGKAVGLVGELAAGVELGEDHLHARHPLLGVDVHRHAAAVVGHLDGTVLVQGHLDPFRVTGDGLVHRVVDHLLGQVVWPGGVGVHAGALAHRLQAAEYLDGGSVVGVSHRWSSCRRDSFSRNGPLPIPRSGAGCGAPPRCRARPASVPSGRRSLSSPAAASTSDCAPAAAGVSAADRHRHRRRNSGCRSGVLRR